jgi:hypothetical protein
MASHIRKILQGDSLQDVSMAPCYKTNILNHTLIVGQSCEPLLKTKYTIETCESTSVSLDESLLFDVIDTTQATVSRCDTNDCETRSTTSTSILETPQFDILPPNHDILPPKNDSLLTTNKTFTKPLPTLPIGSSINTLSPSQKLKLRKLRLNESIKKIKDSGSAEPAIIVDDEDDEFDLSINVINIPASRSSKRSKRTDYDRTNLSGDGNSILSLGSSDTNLILSESSLNSLKATKNDWDIMLLFNRNDFTVIEEESQRRRKLLKSFKQVNARKQFAQQTLPTLDHSNPKTLAPRPKSTGSKYYSFTRPFWLPPKRSQEQLKHQSLSEALINQALVKESKEQANMLSSIKNLTSLRKSDMQTWISILRLTNDEYRIKMNSIPPDVVEMYWRGISHEVRSKVWWKHYHYRHGNNKTPFNQKFCDYYFNLYDGSIHPNLKLLETLLEENSQIKIEKQSNEKIVKTPKFFQQNQSLLANLSLQKLQSNEKITQFLTVKIQGVELYEIKLVYDKIIFDLMEVYPDMDYFENQLLVQKLTKITICYIFHLYDSLRMKDTSKLADYYFSGLSTTVAVYYYNFQNSYKTLVQMCQFSQHHLIELLIPYQVMKAVSDDRSSALTFIENSIEDFFVSKFESCFKSNLNRVYTHFKVIGLKPLEYLPDLILSSLSNVHSFEVTCHLIDVLTFDKDCTKVFCKFILGVFKQISHKLFGSKQEILNLLLPNRDLGSRFENGKNMSHLNTGYDYQFVEAVRSIIV